MVHGTLLIAEERAKINALVAVEKSFTERSKRSISRYLASLENYEKRAGSTTNKKLTPKNLRALGQEVQKMQLSILCYQKACGYSGFLCQVQQLLRKDATICLKSFKKLPSLTSDQKKNCLIFVREDYE